MNKNNKSLINKGGVKINKSNLFFYHIRNESCISMRGEIKMTLERAIDLLKYEGYHDIPYIQEFGTSLLREAIQTVRERKSATRCNNELANAVEFKVLQAEGKI